MIKCLECGFETERLQWTHFKYKCTGRFTNSQEYKDAYPEALLVDPNLAKRTGLTLKKFISKYGDIEGNSRWDSYREKQAYSNTFDYKNTKHGWSEDQFNEYNSSRAQTLEKMISRYGEVLGTDKWMAYCDRQAYTNGKAYFINKYGLKKGTATFLQLNKDKGSSLNPVLLAQKLNIPVDEAVQLILNRFVNTGVTWGSNLEKEFTSMLVSLVGELEYTTFTRPFGKWSLLLNGYVIFDIKHKDCIIEFNGDYWHANPGVYKDDALIRGKTAKEIQERDLLKMRTATDLGFRTYTVWESEFKLNKQETIRKVIEWMQNGQP